MKKVLILGSGALKIGEAGEFDFSGSQCLKALKEEGIKTVLINPNIATYQTSKELADKIYFLPVTPYFVEKVIEKEKPDGILLSFGGQTALNCGVQLHDKGVFSKHEVKVLGTSIQTIKDTEDRALFVKKLDEIGVKTPKSIAVYSIEEALDAVKKIGYPTMVRAAYALGGSGSGVAHTEQELKKIVSEAFSHSNQILVEEYLKGWKEIEYEVVRDKEDNCITVCNMENFDPLGIHTGESIVVAPSQTLTNKEYHMLRDVAIKTIRHLGIVGECNIQYALNPKSEEYRVIEVNARLSRSSALASKATGYPLAFIAAKLALGKALPELKNSVTKETTACYEPALDYVTVKIPRWDLQKFKKVSKKIGSEMKSVGEVMAIGRKFEEALQKAIRMLDIGLKGAVCNNIKFEDLETELKEPTDKRLLSVMEALKQGHTADRIYELTGIDKWFLHKLQNIIKIKEELKQTWNKEILLKAKQYGFSDEQIGILTGKKELDIRKEREQLGIKPVVKQIDTLAAEYPAKTNYLYLTYNGEKDDITFEEKNKVIVLGSGAYRIGSSVEFDWCCVTCVQTLRQLGYNTIMINFNPETVSTDYDMCEKLYFDELTLERVLDIYEKEKPLGIIVSMGGQTPNNLALKLHNQNVKILGTSPLMIDNAEDRHKFSKLLDKINVDQPEWKELSTIEEAKNFAKKVGYPILVRPSYVLSGAAMNVAHSEEELRTFLEQASEVSQEHPVVITKFIEEAKEIEMDAIAKNGKIIAYAISEHVENAGVHSGDATLILPAQKLYLETIRRIKKITKNIAESLEITGPFNIQFLAKENHIKVIECNLRASRTFPFVSKVLKTSFIDLATKSIMDKKLPKMSMSTFELDYVGVKAPQFSFTRLRGADPVLGVEMGSTGEVACLGEDVHEAFLKALLSTGFEIPKKNILLSTGSLKEKAEFLESAKKLIEMGYKIYATRGTSTFLAKEGIQSEPLYWPLEKKQPNVLDFIQQKKFDLIINIPKNYEKEELTNDYTIRRGATDYGIPLITNIKCATLFTNAIYMKRMEDLKIKSWDEY